MFSPAQCAALIAPYVYFALAHNVRSKEEVDAIFAWLKKNGAKIVKEP
jgi:hypothetical protein